MRPVDYGMAVALPGKTDLCAEHGGGGHRLLHPDFAALLRMLFRTAGLLRRQIFATIQMHQGNGVALLDIAGDGSATPVFGIARMAADNDDPELCDRLLRMRARKAGDEQANHSSQDDAAGGNRPDMVEPRRKGASGSTRCM
jgi:hypothetical protein